jgi:dipeptidyl aminopeptidase/acylaminoacyl peptidase
VSKRLLCPLITVLLCAAFVTAQDAELRPGDNLIAENVPNIPLSLVESVDRYTEGRWAALTSWHPTRREMLIITRFGETVQAHQVKFPGGARTQLTFFPDRVRGISYQPTRGDYFIFSKDTNGNEFSQYYRYDFATGQTTLLTDGKSRNTGARWSTAGDGIVYRSTRRNGKDVDWFLVDPANPKTDHLLAQFDGPRWYPAAWSPDDKKILAIESMSINESYLWLFDVASGEKTLLTPRGGTEKISYDGGQWSKDGKGIYVVTDRDSEFLRLVYIDVTTKKQTVLTGNIKWDVEWYDLSPDGRTMAFVTNEDGIGRLHLMNTKNLEETPAPAFPAGLIEDLQWHKNGKDLGLTIHNARIGGDVFSLDVTTGKVERWTTSEQGMLNPESFVEAELIRWKSFDGLTISGFLYRPPARFKGKRPVLINIHGGPEGQSRPYALGPDSYFTNELGLAEIFPNVRGSTGYGKTFLKLDNGLLRENPLKDIGALLDWIRTQSDLDADRVMVTGGSYGGYMTLAVAAEYSDRIRCALAGAAMSNIVTFLEHTEEYRRDQRRPEYGDERDPKMREFLERIAPLNNAEKIKRPLFISHGKNDPRNPVSEAEQMVARVRKNGTPVWYLMAKDEGHGFAKKKNLDFHMYATVLFMHEHLLR